MEKKRQLRRLQQEIETVKQELLALGPIHPGSISGQYHVCGTASCRCHDPVSPQKHGPYNKLTYCHRGKSGCRFVREDCVEELRQRLANYKVFRELTDRWIALSIQAASVEFFNKAGATAAKSRKKKK